MHWLAAVLCRDRNQLESLISSLQDQKLCEPEEEKSRSASPSTVCSDDVIIDQPQSTVCGTDVTVNQPQGEFGTPLASLLIFK